VWRDAQAHWDKRRLAWIKRTRREVDELAFRQQVLNQWVPSMSPPALGEGAWERLRTQGAPSGPLAFGAEVDADHTRAVIVALGGGVAEVVDVLDNGGQLAGRLLELSSRHGGVVGLDASGPAAGAADTIKGTLGKRLARMTNAQSAAAAGQLYDALRAEEAPPIRLREHAVLQAAVSGARRRKAGKVKTWDRDGGPGVTMIALSAALWAAEHAEAEAEPEEPRIF
jgi:hypothetical protein